MYVCLFQKPTKHFQILLHFLKVQTLNQDNQSNSFQLPVPSIIIIINENVNENILLSHKSRSCNLHNYILLIIYYTLTRHLGIHLSTEYSIPININTNCLYHTISLYLVTNSKMLFWSSYWQYKLSTKTHL